MDDELLTKAMPISKSSLSSFPLEPVSENSKFLNFPISPDCLTVSISTIGDAFKNVVTKKEKYKYFVIRLSHFFHCLFFGLQQHQRARQQINLGSQCHK